MTPYANISGKSGVSEYEIGDDFIMVMFHGGKIYTYTYENDGYGTVDEMKELAEKGEGLNTYINENFGSR